jgi:hypothetical protein
MTRYWLKDNIRSLIASIWTIGCLAIFMLVLLKTIKADDKTSYLVLGGIISIVSNINGYYYGASKRMEGELSPNSSTQKTTVETVVTPPIEDKKD